MSFQKVVKQKKFVFVILTCFRTVSFQKVVKQNIGDDSNEQVLELCHFRR